MIQVAKSLIRHSLPNLTAKYQAHDRLIQMRESYLHTSGWMETMRRGYPCDSRGRELPWMNFAAISIIRERLTKELDVFEFGSGYSTIFYAGLAKSVVSVEHDRDWKERMADKLPQNSTVVFESLDEDGKYCRAISNVSQSPDFVVIDGRDRVNCLKQSIAFCASHTVILFDDTTRDRYRPGLEHAQEAGYKVLHVEGLKPGGLELNRSSFLYRSDNCFGL